MDLGIVTFDDRAFDAIETFATPINGKRSRNGLHEAFVAFKDFGDKFMLIGVIVLSVILSVILDRLILKKRDVKEIPD